MSDLVNDISEADFEEQVVKTSNEKPVLVDFWGPGCGPCMMLAPVLEKIAAEQGDSSKIVKVNIAENMGLATKFGVRAVPTLVYFKDGEAAKTVQGARPQAEIVGELENLSL